MQKDENEISACVIHINPSLWIIRIAVLYVLQLFCAFVGFVIPTPESNLNVATKHTQCLVYDCNALT